MTSPRQDLAVAVMRVRNRYAAHPDPDQVDIFGEDWQALEQEVDAALSVGDDDRARQAIRAWETFALEELRP